MTVVHFLRHGEVFNPEKILYGRMPGFKLSARGLEMAERIAQWGSDRPIAQIYASPLERAQQTATPIAQKKNLPITTDVRLIEAANIFEGKTFEVGSGVLFRPQSWKYLWNPWRPSWGEPYSELVDRMTDIAKFAASNNVGKESLCVSHQLPIWILRLSVEGRRFLHDPRKRECTLASITSLTFDSQFNITDVRYSEPCKDLLP